MVGEGYESLMTADYSQIELRVMAHLSEDEGLIQAFTSGEDLHTTAASQVFGVARSAVDAEMRRKIKAMSSEAKASAGIIGALPPGVMGIVYLTTPAYITLLFTEKMGNLMLAGCVIWMSIGIAVMRKMINFKT